MTLIQEAIRAEQISDAFGKYRHPNPEFVQDINAAKAELEGLSWALREIDRLLEEYGDNLHLIEDDLKLIHDSVFFTLADIWHIIGTIRDNPSSPLEPDDYRRNWRRITKYCHERGRQDLSTRLDTYKRFLLGLCRKLKGRSLSTTEFEALRHEFRRITSPEDSKLLGDVEEKPGPAAPALAVPPSGELATRHSYERHRDKVPLSPTESEPGSPRSPQSPRFTLPIHTAPSPPTSPTNTFSTISQISSVDRAVEHWAVKIFREAPSWTPLASSNQRSQFHDVLGQPTCARPSENYSEVVALSFPPDPPGLRVSLHCRRRDWRAKVLAEWKNRRGKTCSACLPLNGLVVYRKGPMLHFCRRLSDGNTNLAWLSIKFSTLERLILFACTFLSMRAHDGKKSVRPDEDWELQGEEMQYGGQVKDNGYCHALRIYRDKASKALRLQASVLGGQLDKTPVWTAFITHYIGSKTWCERLGKNIVCLRELRPHNFSDDYEFQRLPNGAFVLNFENRKDAKDFMGCIEELSREYREGEK